MRRFLTDLGRQSSCVEVFHPHRFESGGKHPLDRMAGVDHVGRDDRGHGKRDDDNGQHVLGDLRLRAHRDAERSDDDRKIAHLSEIDRGHDACPQAEAQRVEDRYDHHPADDDEDGAASDSSRTWMLGTVICIPNATKKSVTKKSRMLTALATTSVVYGKADRLTPAISAPISRESPIRLAAPARKKHQPRAETRTSSGALATIRNR